MSRNLKVLIPDDGRVFEQIRTLLLLDFSNLVITDISVGQYGNIDALCPTWVCYRKEWSPSTYCTDDQRAIPMTKPSSMSNKSFCIPQILTFWDLDRWHNLFVFHFSVVENNNIVVCTS